MSEIRTYTLKHFDTPLLRFTANPSAANASYEILWVNENKRQLLPFGLETSAKGLEAWIKRRNIPKNRAFANAGFEPYSEYYAADIANTLGFDAIDYSLHRWKDTLCSSCELFTRKDYSFVPAADVVGSGGWSAVKSEYAAMGARFEQALSDMLAFDALICNTDRHLGNFGFLTKNSTNKICAPAPLFDHGNSLFYQAYGDDWSSTEALSAYATTQKPCLYDDFFDNARKLMTKATKAKVKKALEFKFTRRPSRNFPAKRLSLIEEQIRLRAEQLLG